MSLGGSPGASAYADDGAVNDLDYFTGQCDRAVLTQPSPRLIGVKPGRVAMIFLGRNQAFHFTQMRVDRHNRPPRSKLIALRVKVPVERL
jgi:hypothetical protein